MSTALTKIDFLIVGQGLAGSLLAWNLIKQGQQVLLVDSCLEQTASRTAAGLINPVTGKRLVKSADIDVHLKASKRLYQQLTAYFKKEFLFKKPFSRLFLSQADINQWQKRQEDIGYKAYLGKAFRADDKTFLSDESLGGFTQPQCAYLDTVLLLDELRQFFVQKNSFINATLNVDDCLLSNEGLEWQGHLAKKVIFCDGYQLQNNQWFKYLPLQPVQGEILTMQTDQVLPKEIVHFGKWLLPLQGGRFKLGATWQWKPLDNKPSITALNDLIAALTEQFPYLKKATLVERKIGVRPGTKDKMPFLGVHPNHSQVMVFNGFGSKGSLTIPWYSECFVNYLLKGEPLPKEANINRYIKN